MTQFIFDLCVDWLQWLAVQFGTDYVTINVVLFCFIMPVFMLMLMFIAYYQYERAEHYKICWQLSMSALRNRLCHDTKPSE